VVSSEELGSAPDGRPAGVAAARGGFALRRGRAGCPGRDSSSLGCPELGDQQGGCHGGKRLGDSLPVSRRRAGPFPIHERQGVLVFGQLQDAVTKTAKAAGGTRRIVVQNASTAASTDALTEVSDTAHHLLATARGAQQLEPIPDEETVTAFSAGLAGWVDASESLAAGERRDVPEMQRAARALDASTDELFKAAAALRRATGQRPDPPREARFRTGLSGDPWTANLAVVPRPPARAHNQQVSAPRCNPRAGSGPRAPGWPGSCPARSTRSAPTLGPRPIPW
jgi:hypothetical protein